MFIDFAKKITNYLWSIGINPVYPATVLILVISYFHFKKLRKWDTLPFYDKLFSAVIFLASFLGILGSMLFILHELGVINVN